jgi:hypothetical protein
MDSATTHPAQRYTKMRASHDRQNPTNLRRLVTHDLVCMADGNERENGSSQDGQPFQSDRGPLRGSAGMKSVRRHGKDARRHANSGRFFAVFHSDVTA